MFPFIYLFLFCFPTSQILLRSQLHHQGSATRKKNAFRPCCACFNLDKSVIVTYWSTNNKEIFKILHSLHGSSLFEQRHLHCTPAWLAPPANKVLYLFQTMFWRSAKVAFMSWARYLGCLFLKKTLVLQIKTIIIIFPQNWKTWEKTLVKITFHLCVSLHLRHLILAQVHKVNANGPSKSLFR